MSVGRILALLFRGLTESDFDELSPINTITLFELMRRENPELMEAQMDAWLRDIKPERIGPLREAAKKLIQELQTNEQHT